MRLYPQEERAAKLAPGRATRRDPLAASPRGRTPVSPRGGRARQAADGSDVPTQRPASPYAPAAAPHESDVTLIDRCPPTASAHHDPEQHDRDGFARFPAYISPRLPPAPGPELLPFLESPGVPSLPPGFGFA